MSEETTTIKKHGVRVSFSWEELMGLHAKGHNVYTDKTRFWLWCRSSFVVIWRCVEAFGRKHDFLEYDADDGVTATEHVQDAKWVSDE